jgi:antitoxin PrlF
MHLHYRPFMATVIEAKSTLTVRNQTTVPPVVRQALKLGRRDQVRYLIQPDGTVILARADSPKERDAVLDSFLEFLAKDMAANPHRLRPIGAKLVKRIRSLTEGVEIDLNAPLAEDE